MAGVNFKIENLDALGRARDRVASLREGGDKLISRAIGTLKRKLPTWVKRDISTQYALPVNKIGKRLRVSADASSVTLTALGRMQRLTNFPCKQTATGLVAQVEKGKSVEVPHGFLRVPTGPAAASGTQAFVRKAASDDLPDKVYDIGTIDGSNRKTLHGYPMYLLGGPAVSDMMTDGDRVDRAIEYGRQLFADEVDRLLEVERGR